MLRRNDVELIEFAALFHSTACLKPAQGEHLKSPFRHAAPGTPVPSGN
jgi:hypothetical protein